MTPFDFKWICVEEDFKYIRTTTWIERHFPISVLISANLKREPIFLCDPNPSDLVSSFVDVLKKSGAQSKTQIKMNFLQTKRAKEYTCTYLGSTKSTSHSLCWFRSRRKYFQEKVKKLSTVAKKPTHWPSETFWETLKDKTRLWVQQCKVPGQHYQELLTTSSVKGERQWNVCYEKGYHFVWIKIGIVQLQDISSLLGGATTLN